MTVDRSQLDLVRSEALTDAKVRIETDGGDLRTYTLKATLGEGKTGVTWKAVDSMDRAWAIKFVLRKDYRTHSLTAEAARVASLRTRFVAHIDYYGRPKVEGMPLDLEPFYAIAVEWVRGQSLKEYLARGNSELTVKSLLLIARTLCTVVAELRRHGLCHNDLHDENIIISESTDALTGEVSLNAVVIDTGTMKTEERRLEQIEWWEQQKQELEKASGETHQDMGLLVDRYNKLIQWFGRSDQEWIVYHLCAISNALQSRLSLHDAPTKRFLWRLPSVLDQMIDPDLGRRLADPALMYQQLERLWDESAQPGKPKMMNPFDLMSAELIRNDRQLRDLFSVEFPGLGECQSSDPIYLYGPRGCGKSTILRAISFKSLLSLENPAEELKKLPFIGVYVPCAAELRSRFWLIPERDYEVTEPHVVRFFNLLLIEQLVDTLEAMHAWEGARPGTGLFGTRDNQGFEICRRIRARAAIPESKGLYFGTSPYAVMKLQIRKERDRVWTRILEREESSARTDAQLLFDVCQDLAECAPIFRDRQVAFLLDDYSKQRIPPALQRRLNQAITFAKQGNPIFKVTSEYGGVDLAGIQEGREVREVNVGLEYVDLNEPERWRFLKNVLEKRFAYLGNEVDLLTVLPFRNLGPGIPMAKEVKRSFLEKADFYYHGFDTISDLCSGDFAMGPDLVRRIFDKANVPWQSPRLIPPQAQDSAIRRFASQEFEFIRYLAPNGRRKHDVVDALCWLARESVLKRVTKKDRELIPLIKIHLDLAEPVLAQLESEGGDSWDVFQSLVDKAILFPIDTSRSRQAHQGTRRYQIRRILLARYGAPLGRHTPIRIDDFERLRFLLTEPRQFVKLELGRGTDEHQGTLFDRT